MVQFSYVDFEGNAHHEGEIVVLDAVAEHVKTIFDQLFARKFPIAKARPMEHYRGDDGASMADNNTSALNDRVITITSDVPKSIHAYGLAIDSILFRILISRLPNETLPNTARLNLNLLQARRI